jgi:hypothetical protein
VNQDSLKLNGTRQLLVYVDGVMLGGSVHSTKRKTACLAITNKENIIEVNAKRTKYVVMSRDQDEDEFTK